MASAWGNSWGAAWGNSWGSIAPPVIVTDTHDGADKKRWKKQIDDRKELRRQISATAFGAQLDEPIDDELLVALLS